MPARDCARACQQCACQCARRPFILRLWLLSAPALRTGERASSGPIRPLGSVGTFRNVKFIFLWCMRACKHANIQRAFDAVARPAPPRLRCRRHRRCSTFCMIARRRRRRRRQRRRRQHIARERARAHAAIMAAFSVSGRGTLAYTRSHSLTRRRARTQRMCTHAFCGGAAQSPRPGRPGPGPGPG